MAVLFKVHQPFGGTGPTDDSEKFGSQTAGGLSRRKRRRHSDRQKNGWKDSHLDDANKAPVPSRTECRYSLSTLLYGHLIILCGGIPE